MKRQKNTSYTQTILPARPSTVTKGPLIGGLALCAIAAIDLHGCKTSQDSGSQALNNGEVVEDPYLDPTVVRLSMVDNTLCTGTLLEDSGRSLVLTAAHCVVRSEQPTQRLAPQEIRVDIKGTMHTAVDVVVHPLYRGQQERDIALVFLDPSLTFPGARRLGQDPKAGDTVTVDGYGVFSMSHVVDDDDGDGMPNGRDYCPNTRPGAAIEIDSKGCAFDQWPDNTAIRNPMGEHRSGIRRSGKNTIASIDGEVISLSTSMHNGTTQTNTTQVASGDSGGPLFDAMGNIIGVTSTASWENASSADFARSSQYASVTSACNRSFIATGTAQGCGR